MPHLIPNLYEKADLTSIFLRKFKSYSHDKLKYTTVKTRAI